MDTLVFRCYSIIFAVDFEQLFESLIICLFSFFVTRHDKTCAESTINTVEQRTTFVLCRNQSRQ